MSEDVRDLIIIGGACAGLTAAVYAARANLKPLVIEGFEAGGQLMITSDVENFPGFPEGVLGPDLMLRFREQAERFGTEFITDDVTSVDFSERPFRVSVGAQEHRARAVIVATGASARQLGLPSEQALQARGVSYCATCDAAFFPDKKVLVVGGGDSALEEATYLTKFAKRRRARAPPRRAARLEDHAGLRQRQDQPLGADAVRGRGGARRRRRPRDRRASAQPGHGRGAHRGVRRLLRGDRPHAQHRALPRHPRDGRERLPAGRAGHDAHEDRGRLRGRRRRRPRLPPGHHRSRIGLPGRARRRALADARRQPRERRAGASLRARFRSGTSPDTRL